MPLIIPPCGFRVTNYFFLRLPCRKLSPVADSVPFRPARFPFGPVRATSHVSIYFRSALHVKNNDLFPLVSRFGPALTSSFSAAQNPGLHEQFPSGFHEQLPSQFPSGFHEQLPLQFPSAHSPVQTTIQPPCQRAQPTSSFGPTQIFSRPPCNNKISFSAPCPISSRPLPFSICQRPRINMSV